MTSVRPDVFPFATGLGITASLRTETGSMLASLKLNPPVGQLGA
jgi:hypothetical protein